MNVVDLHPEDLLDKLYAGFITASERKRLDQHLEGCAVCRFEVQVGEDLEEEVHPPRGVDAIVLGAIGAPRRARSFPWWLAALAAALVAGSALAEWSARAPRDSLVAPPAEVGEREAEPESPALERAAPPPDTAASTEPAPEVAPPLAVASEPSVTATDLFERANGARRAGRDSEALHLYGRLQQRFPESAEARLSHQVVARMQLEEAPEAALEAYDQYEDAQGRLAEEALVGRASALEKLGRRAEERAAWQELLARFPESIHAARARARLAALASENPED